MTPYSFGFLCVCALGVIPVVGCRETARPREWGTAQRIDGDHEAGAGAGHVAIDPQGNAIAVWVQAHGTDVAGYGAWSNRFTPSQGWESAEPIAANEAGHALGTDVAMDPEGNALAVWRRKNDEADPTDTFWANRKATQSRVWPHRSGTRDNVWSNRFTPLTGWGTAERIEANTHYDAWNPEVAIDSQGNAIAVWATVRDAFRRSPVTGWRALVREMRTPTLAFQPHRR